MTSSNNNNNNYYDIDSILAEEELIPSTTLFDFSHLSALDPDGPRRGSSHTNQNRSHSHHHHYLPEGSRIKMPIWAVQEWAMLGFVRLSLPRHYGRRARERLEADPSDADLRKRNERFYMAGQMIVDLIEKSTVKVAKAIAATRNSGSGGSRRREQHTQALEQVSGEAQELRRILLKTYAGERLRRTFDWALSSGGDDDDVSSYLSKLTEMEQHLFRVGASAIEKYNTWSLFGNRRLINWGGSNNPMTPVANLANMPPPVSLEDDTARQVTPGGAEDDQEDGVGNSNKRRRLD